MIIYYNPECSKCQEAKTILEENKCTFEIRDYLKVAPTEKEIKDLVSKLGCKVEDLVRKTEPLFLEKFAEKKLTEEEWVQVLCNHPLLLQRPIVFDGEKAVVGRPPVLVLDLIKKTS